MHGRKGDEEEDSGYERGAEGITPSHRESAIVVPECHGIPNPTVQSVGVCFLGLE